ncbi:MAG TPA: 4a-hydroxytetrahydrobiopterin dehydratase [Bacteroidota bacterium]|nr:4a-hydroxytetrahydrobiopterin dehydratase [Bacteroidota bacterium]
MALLTASQLDAQLATLDGWSIVNGQLHRVFVTPTFHRAIALVVQAGMLADVADHHPDIDIRYNRVTFALSTHSEGGITEKDVALARGIDEAYVGG